MRPRSTPSSARRAHRTRRTQQRAAANRQDGCRPRQAPPVTRLPPAARSRRSDGRRGRRRRSRTAASRRRGRGTGAATRRARRRRRVAAATSTGASSCTTPIAPSTRTSATPGSAARGREPGAQAGLDPRDVARASRAPRSSSIARERDRAGERVGHERRAVHQHARLAADAIPRATRARAERRGERHVAAGQRLADAHDVGRDARVLGGEQLAARAAEAGRDLVEDQQHVVLVAQLAQPPQVRRARRRACRRRPARPARRSTAASSPRVRARTAPSSAASHAGSTAPRRSRPAGAARTRCCGSVAGEQRVHAADRVAHRHRAERVAVVAAAQREQAVLLRAARARAGTAAPS